MLAWFFLMRCTEYAWSNGWDHEKVVTGADLTARKHGVETQDYRAADEVMIWFKSSKQDQLKFGCARNHYRSGQPLCIVEALGYLQGHFPERLHGDERNLPLFRFKDGSPLKREHVQELLETAAIGSGYPPDRMRTHSLRIGGATALYHIRPDTELIKRFGRWTSSSFHEYLWEANEAAADLSRGMASDRTSLMRV